MGIDFIKAFTVYSQRTNSFAHQLHGGRAASVFVAAAGLAILLYTSGSAFAEQSHLDVVPAEVRLFPDDSQQLLVREASEYQQDVIEQVTLQSRDPEIATVTDQGTVRARRPGQTVIQIHWNRQTTEVPVIVGASEQRPPLRFSSDIVPVLTKLGCNSGGCHGKATGQGQFKLSLLGFDPNLDYLALVKQARGRRLFPSAPERSLLLLKATAQMPHGGGRRLNVLDDDYRILKQWVATGATGPDTAGAVLERIEVTPQRQTLKPESRHQLLVTAFYSNGESQDVTRRTLYQSNQLELASVSKSGRIETTSQRGLFSVMARFGGKIATFHAAVPYANDTEQQQQIENRLATLEVTTQDNRFDQLLIQQWRQLGIFPSAETADHKFIRRATIDICGTLPTREEIEAYSNDASEDKRERLINRLLERPEYANYFALKWADILQNRGSGYSTSKQRTGTSLFSRWIRDSIGENKPYDQFVTEIITGSGSQLENPPTIWHRHVRTLPDYVESVAQAFLGVRIQCAQCHHHPFERWSQADYYGLAAVFSRVGRKGGFADAEVPTNETIFLRDTGTVLHPRTQQPIPPRALGGPDFSLDRYDDPRIHLAQWMTKRDNPFLARTMVNRLWAHFLGRGIIHPIDDARSTNPPSNPALLEALSQDFVEHGYDIKHTIGVICNSLAYRLESAPHDLNKHDRQTFARFYPRRLTAEVLLDAISQVLAVPTEFNGGPGKFPAGTRAIELPDENVPVHFLDVFGRPARDSACECERVDSPALSQALELVNSELLQSKLSAKEGYVTKLAAQESATKQKIADVFLRTFGRNPQSSELNTAIEFLKDADPIEGYRSLIWALLATNEFMFNH